MSKPRQWWLVAFINGQTLGAWPTRAEARHWHDLAGHSRIVRVVEVISPKKRQRQARERRQTP